MTKGVGLASVQDSVVALVVFGIAVFAISARTFRTRLD
jgi:hypothetical protein